MRNAISILLIILGLATILVSGNNELSGNIAARRSVWKGPLGIHHSDAGDLVSLSYLENVIQFREPNDFTYERPKDTARNRNVDLYVFGDSYVAYVPDSAFGSVNAYHFARRSFRDLIYNLNPKKRNILVFEYAERYVRSYLTPAYLYEHVKKNPSGNTQLTVIPADKQVGLPAITQFEKNLSRNLEFNIFGYRFWDKFKTTKASLNYYLFKRTAGDAVISKDGSRLFLRETMVFNSNRSSYDPFPEKEQRLLINNIDSIYHHYRAEGFDEVYLSIIPNPVTILQPDIYYNNQIPILQAPGALKGMKTIDVYNPYSKDPNPGRFFRVGDTHWNNNGLQVWLKIINQELKNQSELADSTIH